MVRTTGELYWSLYFNLSLPLLALSVLIVLFTKAYNGNYRVVDGQDVLVF